MKDCQTCGNEIPDHATVCPFCNSAASLCVTSGRATAKIRDINIKADRPTVDEGLVRLEAELWRARQAGARLVRVIHGYGSSGVGGKLRSACRGFLDRQLSDRRIRGFVEGEKYSPSDAARRRLLQQHPDLQPTQRQDSENPGITFVEL